MEFPLVVLSTELKQLETPHSLLAYRLEPHLGTGDPFYVVAE